MAKVVPAGAERTIVALTPERAPVVLTVTGTVVVAPRLSATGGVVSGTTTLFPTPALRMVEAWGVVEVYPGGAVNTVNRVASAVGCVVARILKV
ncbi:hypothetical protein, partial [Curtobacterium sp. PhB137]|uniref:hypothetical protein n=1 Tax=Curtobacterium sp. PhB137 TaxID=2485182 RepID=UPI001C8422A4